MSTAQRNAGMDDFTRRYLYVLIGCAVLGFLWWVSSLDFRVSELNDLLEEDAELAAYPYPFRVESLNNGVARMTSPRSAKLAASQSLRVMYPVLQHSGAVSDEMMAAQDELARIQSHAAELISTQPDVKSVRWVLDVRWLENHGVRIE